MYEGSNKLRPKRLPLNGKGYLRHATGWVFASFTLITGAIQGAPIPALGRPLTEEEIQPYSITVMPDGTNLPEGSGSVREGRLLYNERCAFCHGEQGIEGPATRLTGTDGFFSISDPFRILRIRKNPALIYSMGARWPYATTIFDYVRRAMPHFAPRTLTSNQTYAVTAYILYLNKIVPEDSVMDRNSLPAVIMPGRDRTVVAWPGSKE